MISFFVVIILFLTVPLVFSGIFKKKKPEAQGDIKNSEEDGYFRRFPGAIIEYFRHEYDVHRIVMSSPVFSPDGLVEFEVMELRGIRKSLIYRIPIFHDPFPVYDYYMKEFRNNGFEVIYSVYGEGRMGRPYPWIRNLFQTGKNNVAWKDLTLIMDGNIHCYISGRRKNGDNYTYASVFSVNHFRNDKRTGVFIFITEKPE